MSTAQDLVQKPAPHFTTQDQNNKTHNLTDYLGKWVVLYFYPKDMTPGCTIEACSFRDNLHRITAKGAVVLGVSADSVKRHAKFAENESLTFPLLADEEKKICEAYGALGKKKFMGREYTGILRNTYLIDPNGSIAKVYENVKPAGHVDEIIRDLEVLAR
ncbi:thioredoxin-dependent thiol peroxidase [bacterium]|nr:thioredoxin-dependent thiol peroxidase [bacterium]